MSQIDSRLAVALAASDMSDAPRIGLCMGAALYSGPRLLSLGYNRWHTHPESDNSGYNVSLHAEHVALLRRRHYDRRGRLTMYVARQREDGSLGCSKPCANCVRLCKIAGVARIWFYDYNGKIEEMSL
jgi:deoxycytidylate deaminase